MHNIQKRQVQKKAQHITPKKWTKMGKLLAKWGYIHFTYIVICQPLFTQSTENTNDPYIIIERAHYENRTHFFEYSFLSHSLKVFIARKFAAFFCSVHSSSWPRMNCRLTTASVLVSFLFLSLHPSQFHSFLFLWVQIKWVVSIKFIVVSLCLIDYNAANNNSKNNERRWRRQKKAINSNE